MYFQTEVQSWHNSIVPVCLSSVTSMVTHSYTHTHMRARTVYPHTSCRHTQAVKRKKNKKRNSKKEKKQADLSERHKNTSQSVYIRYRTASAKAPSFIFLTDRMFRPFALKHTFVSNEWHYNQSVCQCQSQWQNHPLLFLNFTVYYQREGLLNNHSAS